MSTLQTFRDGISVRPGMWRQIRISVARIVVGILQLWLLVVVYGAYRRGDFTEAQTNALFILLLETTDLKLLILKRTSGKSSSTDQP